jgi:uncharacterized membrane protein YeaQ/YmgE (transglycosylase-associated protein family)
VVVAIIASPYPGPPVSDRRPGVRTSVVPAVRAATRIGRGDHMTASGIISAIIIGAIIGALGRLVVPGRQPMPIWLTIVIGIVAALIGSLIASALGVGSTSGIDWIELFLQIALAAVGVMLVAGRYRPGRGRL